MSVSEKILLEIFNNCSDAIAIVEDDLQISLYNKGFEKLIVSKSGYPEQSYKIADFITEKAALEDFSEVLNILITCADPIPVNIESKIKDLAGAEKNVLLKFTRLPETGKTIITINEIAKSAVELNELQKHIHILEEIITDTPAPHYVIDCNYRIIYWNKALSDLTGITAEQAIGNVNPWNTFFQEDRLSLAELVLMDDDDEFVKYYEDSISSSIGNQKVYEARVYIPRLDKWLFIKAAQIIDKDGNITGAFETLQDISTIKAAEEKLLKTNRQLEDIIEFLPDATFIVDKYGKVSAWNRAVEEMTGVLKKDIIGKEHDLVAVPFYGHPRKFLVDFLDVTSSPQVNYDFLERKRDSVFAESYASELYKGKGAHIWAIASYLKDEKGIITGAIESVRDISRYKNAEDALRISEELYKNLFDNNPSMYFTINSNGTVLSVNKFGCEELGYSVKELVGHSVLKIFYEEDKNIALEKTILCTENIGQVFNWELRKIRKNKSVLWVKETARALMNTEGDTIIFIVCENITEKKQAEQNLLESERKYRHLVDNSFVGIYLLNDRYIQYCNQKFADYHGYSSPAEIMGSYYQVIIAPESYGFIENEINIRESGTKDYANYEYKGLKKDGTIFDAEIIASRIFYDGKAVIQGTLIDITERKRNEREIKKLSRAVEQNPAGIMISDLNGTIEYVNPSYERISGYDFDELKGLKVIGLKPDNIDIETFESLLQKIKEGQEWHGESQNLRKNGELYWASSLISSIKNEKGEILYYITILEDISEKKELELELKRAVDMAEESSRLKTSLLSNMSHELRTPLTGILGLSQILSEELTDSHLSSFIKKIYLSGKRLMVTLNSILDLSEIESNTTLINIEPYDIGAEISYLLFQYSLAAREKGLTFDIDIIDKDLLAYVDERLCNQIIVNLVDNAVKYTNQGSIRVAVDNIQKEEKKFIRISVIDSGIGIVDENIPIIFEEFRQVSEGYNRSFEGAGLGLTLVKKMLDLLKGEILVESRFGEGSKFTVYFPAIENEFAQIEEEFQPVISPSKALFINEQPRTKVLLVEDNEINMEVITCYIEDFCEVDEVNNGTDAIKKATKNQYDIILMDINLGSDMDGVQATKEIRKIAGYENTPVVALTGYALSGDKERLLSEGLTHYLAKPFEKEELKKLLKGIIEAY